MCGIAGLIGRRGEHVDPDDLGRMCQRIIHRGPDDQGIYSKDNVGLGMRRLSIIDVAGGHQPIHNEDKSIWVVYNGEIYNFAELKAELESRGHSFYTHSDTEVIVHLYEEMGDTCVTKLRGMFAIALYDERQHRLLLARDRLGKKPLHYALADGRLVFGSEIKSILAVAPELSEVDPQGLLQYFYFGYIPDPDTIFTAIKKLPPGHLLAFDGTEVKIRSYWDLPSYGTYHPRSEEECLEELEKLLAEAVRIRLISEVPLGALLSGGVDSSLVVALMARASSKPVKTFSIAFSHQDFNEAVHARTVAERFGTEHHELVVEPDIRDTLESLSHSLDEPFGDSSMIPTYYVSKMARQYVTVALSGDGGDELFAGYDRYSVHLGRAWSDHIPSWFGRSFRRSIYPHLGSTAYGRRLLFNLSLPSGERYIDSVSHLPVLDRERRLFSEDLLAWANQHRSPADRFCTYYDTAPTDDVLSRLMYLDTKTYLTADVLAKVDRMSMLNSLEVRCPILDHVFLEAVTRLPSSWKLRGNQRKYVLKRLAERVGVPGAVLHRPKQGFALPLTHWLRRELKADMLQLLLEPKTLQRGFLKPQAIRQLVDEHLSGRRDRSYEIWLLLVLELWQRNFLEHVQRSAKSAVVSTV